MSAKAAPMKMENLPTQQQSAEQAELVTFAERRERLYQRLAERPDHVGMPTRKIAFLSTERSGVIKNFTGIDSPYEAPLQPELRINTTDTPAPEAAEMIAALIAQERKPA
jgi:hypothetical protein